MNHAPLTTAFLRTEKYSHGFQTRLVAICKGDFQKHHGKKSYIRLKFHQNLFLVRLSVQIIIWSNDSNLNQQSNVVPGINTSPRAYHEHYYQYPTDIR